MERERLAALLADRSDLVEPLEAIAAVDADHDAWTFDDVPVDSGAFGELVGRGVVEKADDGYRLADPAAVRAVLGENTEQTAAGTREAAEGDDGSARLARLASLPTAGVDRRAAVALLGSLAFLALTRTVFAFPAVLRDGAVVLSGNDPYYYRYLVEQVVTTGATVASLPGGIAKGEPLLVAALATLASLLGGSRAVVGQILAWYPVLSALVAGVAVYVVTTRVTRDRRVGLAAVVMLATLPGHGYRTSLGFADHHAFDFAWLALSLVALHAVLARTDTWRARGPWLAAAGLGAAVTGQVLAWEAGPLLIAPVGVAAAALALVDVRADRDPLVWGLPLLVGLGLATVFVLEAHRSLGWHTIVVASAPGLLLVAVAAVLALGAIATRTGASWRAVAGGYVGLGVVSVLGVRTVFPSFWAEASGGVDRLVAPRPIVETQPLFGEGAGWLLLFGLLLAVGLAYLLWATRELARGRREWAAPAAYAWVLLGLTALSIRFGGEASIPLAVFAGLGFVHLAERVDLAARPIPFRDRETRPARTDGGGRDDDRSPAGFEWPGRRSAVSLLVLGLFLCGLGLMQIPIKTGQLTITDETYDTATGLDSYAETHNLSYPQDYVLSEWSRNRVYNYLVNGESRSYGYARSTYPQVLNATAGSGPPGRVGFLVVEPGGGWPDGSVHDRLLGYGTGPGLARYRAVARSGDTRGFATVPGANVTGGLGSNVSAGSARLVTTVSLPDWEFEYRRNASVTDGRIAVRVAHPGEYRVLVDEQLRATVTVPESAVLNGTRVRPETGTDGGA